MTDDPNPIDPDEEEDPTRPPPGHKAITCPECSESTLKSTTSRMAVGPIPGLALGRNQAATLCRRCRGRRWVWYKLVDPER